MSKTSKIRRFRVRPNSDLADRATKQNDPPFVAFKHRTETSPTGLANADRLDSADRQDPGPSSFLIREKALPVPPALDEDHTEGEPRRPAKNLDKPPEDADTLNDDALKSYLDTAISDNDSEPPSADALTSRQLRLARRIAQKRGLTFESDIDAVQQLRDLGIDPFQRSAMLELVVSPKGGITGSATTEDRVQLPQKVDPPQPPSKEVKRPKPASDNTRIREIQDIQRDIARRRRRRSLLLFTRLLFFVALPTLIAGYYYYEIATPMYATKSEFVIQQNEGGAASGGALGGLFSGTGFATSQDSITVQSYLQSRDVMLRLDGDLGFKTVFQDPSIDAIQRLPEDASNEQAYKLFKKNVEIGYDPSEGIIKMEVVAPDPGVSAEWSRQMIQYAEEQIDNLTLRLRGDQMEGAMDSFEDAEAKMQTAQARVLELQEQLGVFDPTAESGGVMSQITTFEVQLQEKRLQLQQLLDNRQPNEARVDGVRGDIARLENVVSQLRGQLTDGTGDGSSLARVSGELRMAEVDLQTRTLMMQQALQQLETSRIEANRQVRYLSVGVSPVPPDEATYPRAFENTLLALLIFSGVYLMCSLTASILREQVSA